MKDNIKLHFQSTGERWKLKEVNLTEVSTNTLSKEGFIATYFRFKQGEKGETEIVINSSNGTEIFRGTGEELVEILK